MSGPALGGASSRSYKQRLVKALFVENNW